LPVGASSLLLLLRKVVVHIVLKHSHIIRHYTLHWEPLSTKLPSSRVNNAHRRSHLSHESHLIHHHFLEHDWIRHVCGSHRVHIHAHTRKSLGHHHVRLWRVTNDIVDPGLHLISLEILLPTASWSSHTL
jgi:hypothetical protein